MRSEIRIFKEQGITAKDKLLPFKNIRLANDIANDKIDDEVGKTFVAEAEKMKDEEIPLLPLSLYRDFFSSGNRYNLENPFNRRRTVLLFLTIAEAYEKKGRFIEKIADVLWAIMEESGWVIPPHYQHSIVDPKTHVPEIYREDQLPGVDLRVATTSGLLALTKYLLKDKLDEISPVICKKVDHLVYMRFLRPYVSAVFGWMGAFYEGNAFCNNWLPVITAEALLCSAVCCDDLALRERVVDKALWALDNYTACQNADGLCDEGPGYWAGAAGSYFDCLEILEDLSGGAINVYDHPLVKKLGEYAINVYIHDKSFICFSDAHPELDQPGKMIMRYGQKCNLPNLYAFGKTAEAKNKDICYFVSALYRTFKDALTPEVHEGVSISTNKSVWYSNGKLAVFRENERTDKGFFLAAKGGNNAESHNHLDVGCFVLYYDGKPVVIDPSHGSYNHGFFKPETRYKRWYMKSAYHNIPNVDGFEQFPELESASANEVCDVENQTLSMELKNAFPKEAGILKMHRTLALERGKITVKDEVVLDQVGEITFSYLTLDKPQLLSDGKLKISQDRVLSFPTDGVELCVEKVENKWLPYEDLDFQTLWHRDCLWRVCLKAKAQDKTVAVTIE